jgi:hypothetical protein
MHCIVQHSLSLPTRLLLFIKLTNSSSSQPIQAAVRSVQADRQLVTHARPRSTTLMRTNFEPGRHIKPVLRLRANASHLAHKSASRVHGPTVERRARNILYGPLTPTSVNLYFATCMSIRSGRIGLCRTLHCIVYLHASYVTIHVLQHERNKH